MRPRAARAERFWRILLWFRWKNGGKLTEEVVIVAALLDAAEHPEVLEKYKIMSAPGIIINGELAYSGGGSEAALRERLTAPFRGSG